jgi:PLP dependent protein
MAESDLDRTAELAANLDRVRARINAACAAVGRRPAEVTLIAVTKNFPADDVRRLTGLGIRELAESRDQEARQKTTELAGLTAREGLRWHFVGQLQRNKAGHVARYAAVVHSVDRRELADVLAAAAARVRTDPLDVLLQVNLDPDPDAGRGGARPDAVLPLADHVAGLPALRLAGLMAVAPLGAEPLPAFTRLAAIAGRLRAEHPGAVMLSAGMSTDLEAAIESGTTHVRVGTALLGGRTRPVG